MKKIKGVFEKKNVVITGGAGFIGSHLCEKLLKQGLSKVICIDNFSTGLEMNIDSFLQDPNFKFIKHDITEPFDITSYPEFKLFEAEFQGIQEIYNCASPTSYKDPKRLPLQTARTNSVGLMNVLNFAKKHGAKMVHLSSAVVYGEPLPETNYFREDYWGFVNPLGGRASYNESKRFGETLCAIYREQEGVDVKIARIFFTYGPRMKMGEGRMIPDFIASALDNKDVVVYGTAESKTSCCYEQDTTDALLKLMDSKEKGPLNIGGSQELVIKDIAQKIITMIKSKSNIVYRKPHIEFQIDVLPDITKAKNTIGWFPVIPLDQGLGETIHYIQSARSRYEEKGLWKGEE